MHLGRFLCIWAIFSYCADFMLLGKLFMQLGRFSMLYLNGQILNKYSCRLVTLRLMRLPGPLTCALR